MRVLIVGSGISGSTAARLLADEGHDVEVWEARDHTGGNCHDEKSGVDRVIYKGKIDEYFGCSLGRLPYRSLRFEHRRSRERLPHAVINQCNRLPHTREYDHAYFSLEDPEETVITREYPLAHDASNEPYYPMPFGEGQALYQRYKELAAAEKDTLFLGRLATYSYLDMWMAVAQAMVKVGAILKKSHAEV
jgi:UDP-galactopyranose mutase